MPSTTNRGYEVQTTGSNSGTWGGTLNDNMIQYLDQNMGGVTTLSLSSTTPVALSQAQARNGMLRLTGTLLANITISASGLVMTGFYYWENLTSGAFTISFDNGIGSSLTLPQARRGVMWVDGTNGPRMVAVVGSVNPDPIPTGTVMLFYQNAAPAGWTISAALNDYAIKIVSSGGGVSAGSVPYSTLFATTSVDPTALVASQIPSSGLTFGKPATIFQAASGGNNVWAAATSETSLTGAAGSSHTHTLDMRVRTASVIIATKV